MPQGEIAGRQYPCAAGNAATTIRCHHLFPFSAERRAGTAGPGFETAARSAAAGRFAAGEYPRQFAFAAASGDFMASLAGADPKDRCDAERDVAGGNEEIVARQRFS